MMRERKTSYPSVNVGSSFMLVILIILCMVVFAVLCLSGAMRDAGYGDTRAQRTQNYYTANNLAEEKLAEIDRTLEETAGTQSPYTAQYQNAAIQKLGRLEGVTATKSDGASILIQYTVPVGEEESLSVSLLANDRDNSGRYYRITQWQQSSTAEWKGSDTLPVLGSE